MRQEGENQSDSASPEQEVESLVASGKSKVTSGAEKG